MPQGVAQARVKVAGTEVPTDAMAFVQVDLDVDQPSAASVTVNNTNEYKYSEKVNQGDSVEVTIGSTTDDTKAVFEGEVVGLEPVFDVGGETKVIIRAFNKLHRLTRTRKSKTFEQKSDSDIVSQIAGDYGLSPDINGDVSITYDHIYQAHLTDLEFLLERARRINYEILCDNKKLTFRQRKLSGDADSGITLQWGKDASGAEFSLQRFSARLNSSGQVTEVTVRGYDIKQKKEFVGKATSIETPLGSKQGGDQAKSAFGEVKAAYDIPVDNLDEANKLATSLIEDLALGYITGEGLCKGNPNLVAGIVVTIDAKDKRFNGKYYLTGVSHRYTHKASGGAGGYTTLVKFRRNADS